MGANCCGYTEKTKAAEKKMEDLFTIEERNEIEESSQIMKTASSSMFKKENKDYL